MRLVPRIHAPTSKAVRIEAKIWVSPMRNPLLATETLSHRESNKSPRLRDSVADS